MGYPKTKSNMNEQCDVCNQIFPKYKLSEHYAICHILWKTPLNIPKYSYNDGYDIIQYTPEQNQQINSALINKQRQVKITVNDTIHKINLDRFDIKINYLKPFWCCSFVNFAYLSASFDNKTYDCKSIMEIYQINKKTFPFYDIYLNWVGNKIPIYLEQ